MAACNFVSTKDSSTLAIKATDADTPQAKQHLEACLTLIQKDAEAAKVGKKQFGSQVCSGCHGGNANGLMAPSIIDEHWQYAKHRQGHV